MKNIQLGVQIARTIISGDVELARSLRGVGLKTWSVAESRALMGACRWAQQQGWKLVTFESFV